MFRSPAPAPASSTNGSTGTGALVTTASNSTALTTHGTNSNSNSNNNINNDDFGRLEVAAGVVVDALRGDEAAKDADPYRRLLMGPAGAGSHLYRPARGSTDEWIGSLGKELSQSAYYNHQKHKPTLQSSQSSQSSNANASSGMSTNVASDSGTATGNNNRQQQQHNQQHNQQQRSPLMNLGRASNGGEASSGARGSGGETTFERRSMGMGGGRFGGTPLGGGTRTYSSQQQQQQSPGTPSNEGGGGGMFHDARSSSTSTPNVNVNSNSNPNKLLLEGVFPSSTLNHVSSIPMPPYLAKQITSEAKVTSLMGLLPEANLAWMSADSTLYLWSYNTASGSTTGSTSNDLADFCSFDIPSKQCVSSVGIARPKPGVFISQIKWVVVIVTHQEVLLCALLDNAGNGNANGFGPNGSLQLIPTTFVVPTEDVTMYTVTSTSSGRIFLGGADGHLYEVAYEQHMAGAANKKLANDMDFDDDDDDDDHMVDDNTNSSWTSAIVSGGKRMIGDFLFSSSSKTAPQTKRRRVCRKVQHTQPGLLATMLPSFLQRLVLTGSSSSGSGGGSPLLDMAVDESRGVLHTLSQNGTLCVYALGDDLSSSSASAAASSSSSMFGTSSSSAPSLTTTTALALLTSMNLSMIAKSYLEALKRHAMYSNSKDYTFAGGAAAALSGLGGQSASSSSSSAAGGGRNSMNTSVECAAALLKMAETASAAAAAASSHKSHASRSATAGNAGAGAGGDILMPTRLFVVPPSTSQNLFAIVVTQGGLRLYLSLPDQSSSSSSSSSSSAVTRMSPPYLWKQRLLCHVRSPPPSVAAILMSQQPTLQGQGNSNKYLCDDEGMAPGILKPLNENTTNRATHQNNRTSSFRGGASADRRPGPFVNLMASHVDCRDEIFVLGLDGDKLLNASSDASGAYANADGCDGLVATLPDIALRRMEVEAAPGNHLNAGSVGFSSPVATTHTSTTNANHASSSASSPSAMGGEKRRRTNAVGINEVVTCPLPPPSRSGSASSGTASMTNHSNELALLPGGKICHIAGVNGLDGDGNGDHQSSRLLVLWQQSVTPSRNDDKWNGSLALGHLPLCPPVVSRSTASPNNTNANANNTMTATMANRPPLRVNKYKLRLNGAWRQGFLMSRNHTNASTAASRSTRSTGTRGSTGTATSGSFQLAKPVPLPPMVQQFYQFLYQNNTVGGDYGTNSNSRNNGNNNSIWVLNAGGIHELRPSSVMDLFASVVSRLPSSAFVSSSRDGTSISDTIMARFVTAYSQEEVCDMSLVLAISSNSSLDQRKRGRQLAMSYGGRPFYDSNSSSTGSHLMSSNVPSPSHTSVVATTSSPGTPIGGGGLPSSSSSASPFTPSSLHRGVSKLLSRLLRSIWLKPLVVVVSPVAVSSSSSRAKKPAAKRGVRNKINNTPPKASVVEFLLDANSFDLLYPPLKALEAVMREVFKSALETVPGGGLLSNTNGIMMDVEDSTSAVPQIGYLSSALLSSSSSNNHNHNINQGPYQRQQQQRGTPSTSTSSSTATGLRNDATTADLLEKQSLHNLYRLLSRTTQLLSLWKTLYDYSSSSNLSSGNASANANAVEWGLLHQLTVHQLVCAPEAADRMTALLQSLLLSSSSNSSSRAGGGFEDARPSSSSLQLQLAQQLSQQCYLWFSKADMLAQEAMQATLEAQNELVGSINFGRSCRSAATLWTRAAACWKR
jgi:hypothetical protein